MTTLECDETTGAPGDAPSVRVLIAEDDASYLRLLQVMLRKFGRGLYEVRSVGRLDDALPLLLANWPHVLMLDLSLPDSDGLATVEVARSVGPDVAVVVLTGNADGQLARDAFRAGVQDYLIKDEMTGPLLVRCLRHALQRTSLERSLADTSDDLAALLGAVDAPVFRVDTQGETLRIGSESAAPTLAELVSTAFARALLEAVQSVVGGGPSVTLRGAIRAAEAITPCSARIVRRTERDALVVLRSLKPEE